jgi:hypothetical protein
LTSRANKLAPTATCCLVFARKLCDGMNFLLRVNEIQDEG